MTVSENERIVTLGQLAGKIRDGTGHMISAQDDQRDAAKPGKSFTFTFSLVIKFVFNTFEFFAYNSVKFMD